VLSAAPPNWASSQPAKKGPARRRTFLGQRRQTSLFLLFGRLGGGLVALILLSGRGGNTRNRGLRGFIGAGLWSRLCVGHKVFPSKILEKQLSGTVQIWSSSDVTQWRFEFLLHNSSWSI
jgi:hypothetical protein